MFIPPTPSRDRAIHWKKDLVQFSKSTPIKWGGFPLWHLFDTVVWIRGEIERENRYVQVYSNSNVGKKGSEKNIVRPQEVQNSWFLVKWSMTHYTLRSVFFRAHPTPPICLKTPKCAIFSPSLAFHFKNHPNVGVYRETFKTGKLAQNFSGLLYMWGLCPLIFGEMSSFKLFTVTVTMTVVPPTFAGTRE